MCLNRSVSRTTGARDDLLHRGPAGAAGQHPHVRRARDSAPPAGVGGRLRDPAVPAPGRRQGRPARRSASPRKRAARAATCSTPPRCRRRSSQPAPPPACWPDSSPTASRCRTSSQRERDLIDRYVRPTLAGELIGVARGHRAERRLRRRRHHHPRRAGRRPLRHQRREDLHHLRRPGRLRDHRGPHRRPRSRRHLADRGRQGHPRLHRRPVPAEDGLALLRHRRAVVRRRTGAGDEPGRRGELGFLPDRRAVRRRADRPRGARLRRSQGAPWSSPRSTAATGRRSASR